MLVVILCEYFTSQFYSDNLRKLYISFWTDLWQMKIWKFVCLFYLSNWRNQSSLEVLSLDQKTHNSLYLKRYSAKLRTTHDLVLYVSRALFGSLCCSRFAQYVLFSSSSLRCFKPNILIWISCLVAFMFCSSCSFGFWAIWVFYSPSKG